MADRVLAGWGSFFSLPARSEGIIPGTSNRRLTRFVGDRMARQLIMFGRRLEAGTAEGALLCDDVVERYGMDDAIRRDAELLVDSGTVSAAANRKAMRMGEETVDEFRLYQSMCCREQARCLRSPALIANLERRLAGSGAAALIRAPAGPERWMPR